MDSHYPYFTRKIYFECLINQDESLNTVNCLNILLQGPFYSKYAVDQLKDNLEKMGKVLNQSSISSTHAIDIIFEALNKYCTGIEFVPIENLEILELLEKDLNYFDAVLFYTFNHWYSFRQVDKIWFNLNSANESLNRKKFMI